MTLSPKLNPMIDPIVLHELKSGIKKNKAVNYTMPKKNLVNKIMNDLMDTKNDVMDKENSSSDSDSDYALNTKRLRRVALSNKEKDKLNFNKNEVTDKENDRKILTKKYSNCRFTNY